MSKAYEEVIDFIARGSSPRAVADFCPSQEVKARVAELVAREKTQSLTAGEKAELEDYLRREHIMRLAKARARQFLSTRQP